jgi:16S rRNA (guanine966-N2)-methyltransferase
MRIVAGQWRGRRIKAPADDRVRPTADRVREAWMSIVSSEIPEARVVDLFAGSGALGLEALSRGAASVDFVEISSRSITAIRDNLATLGGAPGATIHRADALRFAAALDAGAYDLAFADPPYGQEMATRMAELWLATPFARTLGIEHARSERLPGSDDRRTYGDTAITFYRTPDPS